MSEVIFGPRKHTELFVDDHVQLREVTFDQAETLFSLTDANREYLAEWLPWVNDTNSAQDSTSFIKDIHEKRDNGQEYGFGIYVDGNLAGHTSLMHVLGDDRDPEIGYWIGQEFSGQGLTSKSADALTNFAFEKLGLSKVIIRADTENLASNKIAENLGYTCTHQAPEEDSDRIMNIWMKGK